MTNRQERGQSTVEFALVIPLVIIAVLAVLQVALIAYSQLAVTHISREVARTLVVEPTADVGQIANNAAALGTDDLTISVSFEDLPGSRVQTVFVSISYRVPPVSGLFARFLSDFEVRAQVKMLAEF